MPSKLIYSDNICVIKGWGADLSDPFVDSFGILREVDKLVGKTIERIAVVLTKDEILDMLTIYFTDGSMAFIGAGGHQDERYSFIGGQSAEEIALSVNEERMDKRKSKRARAGARDKSVERSR